MSPQVLSEEHLVGEENWVDTLPNPVHPNATTAEEGFSEDFSDEEKANGRQVLHDECAALEKQPEGGVLLVDTNKLILDRDPNSESKSIHHLLLGRGYEKKAEVLCNEIVAYALGTSIYHVAIVHKPLGLAGDSRPFIKIEWKTLRGLALTTLSHVTRPLRGLPPLNKDDKSDNPLLATFGSQIARIGWHQHPRVGAVVFRQLVSSPSKNAIQDTRIGSLPHVKDAAVSGMIRRPKASRAPVGGVSHQKDATIIARSRAIISQAKSSSDEDVERMVQRLDSLLTKADDDAEGDVSSGTKSYRWKSLMKQFVPGSELEQKVEAVRNQTLSNKGNRTKRGSTATQSEIRANNGDITMLMHEHAPDEEGTFGSRFWAYFGGGKDDVPLPPEGSKSVCGKYKFKNFDFLTAVGEHGLKERFKPRNAGKGGTIKMATSTKYPEYSLMRWIPPNKNGGVVVTIPGANAGWALVYIYKKVNGESMKKRKTSEYPPPRPFKRSKMMEMNAGQGGGGS